MIKHKHQCTCGAEAIHPIGWPKPVFCDIHWRCLGGYLRVRIQRRAPGALAWAQDHIELLLAGRLRRPQGGASQSKVGTASRTSPLSSVPKMAAPKGAVPK